MRVYCISGKARHGKDTVGKFIQEAISERGLISRDALLIHNADLLKFICEKFFGWDGKKDERGRSLLQTVGTDVVRKKNPDFWVDFLINVIKLFDPDMWTDVIIPDCRFPNEIRRWKEEYSYFDVVHIRVERPECAPDQLTAEQMRHSSETALDGYPADHVIVNDGTPEDLRAKVYKILEERNVVEHAD